MNAAVRAGQGGALLAAAAVLTAGFGVTVADAPFAVDRAILAAMHGAGPPGLRKAMAEITALGSGTILIAVVAAVAGLLLVLRAWHAALLTVAASTTGAIVVGQIKRLAERARPDLADPLVAAHGYSFPSAHAANAAVCYLTLAAVAARALPDAAARRYVYGVAVLLVVIIGFSRIHLGVHWPSDVLAGWGFGALWALGWRRVGAALTGRGATVPPP